MDVLVVASHVTHDKRIQVMKAVHKVVDFFPPFEIHIISTTDYKNGHKQFIKADKIKT